MTPPDKDAAQKPGQPIRGPRGTRDLYPDDLLKRRWLEHQWRSAAVRHAFDEIDGPTFEHLDLYTRKSGEGIVSELFSFTRQGGSDTYALRPEFTPTLARMVAARANSLPKPIKWFSVGPYFRAERPQRGRLREFLQWNVDVLGDDSPRADAECIACCVEMLRSVGLTQDDVVVRVNHRGALATVLTGECGVKEDEVEVVFQLVDAIEKLSESEFAQRSAERTSLSESQAHALRAQLLAMRTDTSAGLGPIDALCEKGDLTTELQACDLLAWCHYDPTLARGLAYYTGTVFEVHEIKGAERAVAGGGRYDNLIELMGGPPTPAVGFAMGDVVLSLILEDRGLQPSPEQMAETLGRRCDVFVIAASDEAEASLSPTLASLRRSGLIARRSYKTTRNVGKLLKDAAACNVRFALILETPDEATVKDLHSGEQRRSPLSEALSHLH